MNIIKKVYLKKRTLTFPNSLFYYLCSGTIGVYLNVYCIAAIYKKRNQKAGVFFDANWKATMKNRGTVLQHWGLLN